MAINNIEKLYELAKVEKPITLASIFCGDEAIFTYIKQLELIKLLSSDLTGFETYLGMDGKYHMTFGHTKASNISYEQALAELICELWTDLKGEVQEKIRRILQ